MFTIAKEWWMYPQIIWDEWGNSQLPQRSQKKLKHQIKRRKKANLAKVARRKNSD